VKQMSRAVKLHLERLERGLRTAAKLVVHHGDEFIWVFERIERERDKVLANADAVQRARKISSARKH